MNQFNITPLFLLLGHFCFAQNILIVNQDPNFEQSAFVHLEDAVNAASAGDFIYIYPGQYEGSSVVIDKTLNLIGVGYLLSDNYPNHGYLQPSSKLNHQIQITSGGENTICKGIEFYDLAIQDVNEILITRCRIHKGILTDSQNTEVHSCYIGGHIWTNQDAQLLTGGFLELQFTNCIFADVYNLYDRKSIFYTSYLANSTGSLNLNRCITRNQLFANHTQLVVTIKNSFSLTTEEFIPQGVSLGSGSIVLNSLIESSICKYASVTENIFSIDPADEFVGYPISNNYSFDAKYALLPNSLGIDYAQDGGDCGIFGGTKPYIPSGAPTIPFIYHFDAPHETSTGSGIDVNIRVKSQNE